MGKRKHRSSSSDDGKRKRSRSSSISTSSSADVEPTDRRNTTEDVGSDSQKQFVSCIEKKPRKHKKRRKSTESTEKKKTKKKKAKKEHKKSKKHKSKHSRHSSPESFGPVPPTSSAAISESRKCEQVDEVSRNERVMVPMTKEEWEKERNTIRHVFDPETGRNRLVRGNGEILEEIVSKKRHAEINKQATFGDGIFYQFKAGLADKSITK